MAKINLTNQQNQENPSIVVTLASLGVLMCMVVTVLGIKLWWFKHRLSFEQNSTQNGAAGGNPPMVVVPRRNKSKRFHKDKRWSQQISENVEVHGVFRQKQEDDLEIQRPQQLPPVRIRQLSESTQSLILPPARNKRRQQQVHSTAFEDMEIVTPTFDNSPAPSSSVLSSTNDGDSRLSLTFEEFQKQFKIKEIKPDICETPKATNEVLENPVPPLRLSRSSSAMVKPEKPQHFLKSSQSITIPEHHKTIERRPTDFSRPTEDLTKIDDYEEPQLFENFGERRPTGYIKYEEVDRDLNERYEVELNQLKGNSSNQGNIFDYKFTENGNWESAEDLQALEALRNEKIIYQNDLNLSEVTRTGNFHTKSFTTSFNDDDFIKDKDHQDISNSNDFKISKSSETMKSSPEHYEDYHSTKHRRPTGYVRDVNLLLSEPDEDLNYKPVKDRRPTEFVRNIPQELTNDVTTNIDSANLQDDFDSQFSNWPQFEEKIETPKVNLRKFENHDFESQTSVDNSEDIGNTNEKPSISFDLPDISDNSDQEHFEKNRLKHRRPTGYNRNWPDENIESEDLSENEVDAGNSSLKHKNLYNQMRLLMRDKTKESSDKPELRFELSDNENSGNENFENSPLKQRRPTGYVRKVKEEDKELENLERNVIQMDVQQTERSVKFHDSEDIDFEKSSLNQRRPTEYVRNTNTNTVSEEETQPQKVKFEISNWPENNVDNYSLNQRRPMEYVRNPVERKDSDEEQDIVINELKDNNGKISKSLPDDLEDFEKWIAKQRRDADLKSKSIEAETNNEMFAKDSTRSQVTFDNSIDFESDREYTNTNLQQRRPTGYIKKSQVKELTDEDVDESDLKVSFAASTDFKESDYENSHIAQRRPTGFIKKLPELHNDCTERYDQEVFKNPSVRFQDIEQTDSDDGNSQSPIKQRRPTGFVRTPDIEKLFGSSKEVNFNLSDLPDEEDHFENEALKARRPTGYVRRSEIEGLVNSNDVDPLWQELEKDLEGDFTQNLEEEFAKIRHSYEFNEGDFLELKRELKISPIKPTGFGKTIEDDWDNFEKLEKPKIMQIQKDHEEIQILYNDEELSTTSILKESRMLIENQQIIKPQEDINLLPRKSKVTFDFKTEEHIIPARKSEPDSEEDDYYEDISDDDNVYNKPPPALPVPPPPQPMQRLTQINYSSQLSTSPTSLYSPVVSKPTSITLFASQVSQEDNVEDDSWSAIRKHRNLTVEFQQLSIDSTTTSPPPSFNTPPPKPAFRNPLAQLAIQRAKEVRMDMDGFKSRSINSAKKHPEASKRNQEKMLNLKNDDFDDTEA